MRISRLFTEAALQPGKSLLLDEKPSHYLSKVLRASIDTQLILFNGDGQQYPAIIRAIGKKQVEVDILQAESVGCESPLNIHLGIAVSKGDRMDWIVQKATELGVNAITPLRSERTELKLKGERLIKKMAHWRNISISACEQCGRNQLPELYPYQTLPEWCNRVQADSKFVLHHRTDLQLDTHQQVNSAALLIGPEGGLSETEIMLAESREFLALNLGPRVLRTETAPMAAITVLQHSWGDM